MHYTCSAGGYTGSYISPFWVVKIPVMELWIEGLHEWNYVALTERGTKIYSRNATNEGGEYWYNHNR